MKISIVSALTLLAGVAFAQTSEDVQGVHYGPFLEYSLDQHVANFQQLPGIPNCCPQFTSGTGSGVALGGVVRMPLTTTMALSGLVTFATFGGTLSHEEPTTVIVNGVSQTGSFLHTIKASLGELSIEPAINYHLGEALSLSAGIGAGIMLNASYSQQESISQPSNGGTFLDSNGNDTHSRIRNQSSGSLPGSNSIRVAPFVGLMYELPLNMQRTWFLVPQVMYTIGVTPVVSNLSWSVNTFRAGVSVEYAPPSYHEERRRREYFDTVRVPSSAIAESIFRSGIPRTETIETVEGNTRVFTDRTQRTDTLFVAIPKPVVVKSKLTANIAASGVEPNGQEGKTVRLVVEEFYSRLMTPLLNYVFFDENSAEIPPRYERLNAAATSTFEVGAVNSTLKLPTYHHLLNIIGRRLSDNPTARITLTGCNQDLRGEKGNTALSRRRAEAVQQYLTDAWHVQGNRITIKARNLPEKSANVQTPDGAEENRRVEIASDDETILAAVITDDTIRTASPPIVRFRQNITSDSGGLEYKLSVAQDGKVLKKFEGKGEPPATLDWRVDEEKSSIPHFEGSLVYTLVASDRTNNAMSTADTIPVEQITISKKRHERRGDKEIDRFSLILFDIRSSEIGPNNQRIVQYIKDAIKPGSTVTLTGYSDRLGDPRYNRQLAEQRAHSTALAIGSDKEKIVENIGQASLYNDNLAEGRLYTRTVDVTVETPVK